MLAPLAAQARTEFVFHAYVCPIYGDDTLASQLNPDAASGANGYPLDPFLGTGTGHVEHAPYAFKTVTAAVAWVNATFGDLTAPWPHPTNGTEVFAVILHCLPGLYGPVDSPALPETDAASGLDFNGETFPIVIPENVSIQGTSALDTIFDGRDAGTRALLVIQGLAPSQHDHANTFVDSVTIRRARPELINQSTWSGGAGIEIAGDVEQHPVISNCFLCDNTVGVAVISDSTFQPTAHNPHLVNNTFAWNDEYGIWNGEDFAGTRGGDGVSKVNCINNVFVTRFPSPKPGNTSAFCGMTRDDMEVSGTLTDWNAYVPAHANLDRSVVWTFTNVRAGAPAPGAPTVDLSPFAGSAGHGNLFIRDILENSGQPPSEHDFRLAPSAARHAATERVGLAERDRPRGIPGRADLSGVPTCTQHIHQTSKVHATRTPLVG